MMHGHGRTARMLADSGFVVVVRDGRARVDRKADGWIGGCGTTTITRADCMAIYIKLPDPGQIPR